MESIKNKIKKISDHLARNKTKNKKTLEAVKGLLKEKTELLESIEIDKTGVRLKPKNKAAANELFFVKHKIEKSLKNEFGPVRVIIG